MSAHRSDGVDERQVDDTTKRPFVRRHRRGIIALVTVFALVAIAFVGYGLYLNSSLDNVDRVSIDPSNTTRASDDAGTNILLMGVDHASGHRPDLKFNIAKDARKSVWPENKYNSDTMMIMHVSADNEKLSVVSIPRDSYVDIYSGSGDVMGKNRVNHAMAAYGPAASVITVEKMTDLRIDHLAMVDFDSFQAITNALDGVTVTIPETIFYKDYSTDPEGVETSQVAWPKGPMTLKGETALRYVKDRKNLSNSDYSRIDRQQNFMRAALQKLVSKGTLSSPRRLKRTLDAVTKNLTVDDDWSASDMRGLAFSLRGISSSQVTYVTVPIRGYGDKKKGIGSVVHPDESKMTELFTAVRANTVEDFIAKYPKQQLNEEGKVE